MSPLLIGTSAIVSLLLIPSLAQVMMRKERNTRDDMHWPLREGVRVLVIITEVQGSDALLLMCLPRPMQDT
jgi:multidrug efflux pump subunit AcrB